jgi:dCMP deaminase
MINDEDYLKICEIIAAKSHSTRNKVGAVIVKDGNIISFGYNGTPSGFDNQCEDENGVTKPEVLHAESNAILKCACSVNSSEGATLYTLLSPCFECAKLIIQARIVRVVFKTKYRDLSGIKLLFKAGIFLQR